MPATLESVVEQLATHNAAFDELKKSVSGVVEEQKTITKSIQNLPPIYPADFNPETQRLKAVPKDQTEEGRFFLFKSFGHFASEVKIACISKRPTETLEKAYKLAVEKAIVGASESVGQDGGYLVPPEFSNKIFERVYDDSALLKRCDNYTVVGNTMTFPRTSETSRATGSRWGGVQSYWIGEGGAGTLSKPGFGTLTLKLNKLMTLGAITEEMMSDQSVMPQYMLRTFSDEINFVISDAIFRGTGAGMPLGILNAPCTISVSKEGGQAADTIVTNNIVKMYARMWARSLPNAVWFYNQNVFPQLATLTLGIGTAGVTTWMPPGGLSGKPYSTILGLPAVPIEQASSLGDVGDLSLVDLSQMVVITKGGPNSAQSMHFYFDTEQTAFRTSFRIDAQPWWPAALTPYKGSETQSPFVTLAERA